MYQCLGQLIFFAIYVILVCDKLWNKMREMINKSQKWFEQSAVSCFPINTSERVVIIMKKSIRKMMAAILMMAVAISPSVMYGGCAAQPNNSEIISDYQDNSISEDVTSGDVISSAETSKSETSKPETSKPETSKPETSKPETS